MKESKTILHPVLNVTQLAVKQNNGNWKFSDGCEVVVNWMGKILIKKYPRSMNG